MNNFNIFPEKFLILHKSFQAYFNNALKNQDINGSDAKYFLLLSRENLSQAQLALRIKHDKARIARVVSQLLSQGYIEYDESDNIKNKKLKLTQKGRDSAENCKKIFKEYIKKLTFGIDKLELEQTFNLLCKLASNAEKTMEENND